MASLSVIQEPPYPRSLVQVAGRDELSSRAESVRELCVLTRQLLFKPFGVYGNFVNRLTAGVGVPDPIERHAVLTNGLAEIVETAIGFKPDTVVYPCRGTDLSSAAAFCRASNNGNRLVTIDQDNLFQEETRSDARIVGDLEEGLKRRLSVGYQELRENLGVLGFALEMNLLRVDPRTIQFISREKFGHIISTHLQFEPEGGRPIDLYDFSGVNLDSHFGPNVLSDRYISCELSRIIGKGSNIMLLRKAAMNDARTTGPFYDLLPPGSVVVSDKDEVSTLHWTPSLRGVELVNLNSGLDERFERLQDKVGALAPNDQSFTPSVGFGYLEELKDLRIYSTAV